MVCLVCGLQIVRLRSTNIPLAWLRAGFAVTSSVREQGSLILPRKGTLNAVSPYRRGPTPRPRKIEPYPVPKQQVRHLFPALTVQARPQNKRLLSSSSPFWGLLSAN